MLGIYVHIPFCERKCNYCAFSSFVFNENEKNKYIDHLLKEITAFDFKNYPFNENLRLLNKDKTSSCQVDSIYIGGGTPSLLNKEDLTKILQKLRQKFDITKNCEITIECNPNSLDDEKAKNYLQLGINRLSLGIQSLDDDDLKFTGRIHTSKQALESVDIAKKAGFKNISCDLLIGLPNQTPENFVIQLKTLLDKGACHISSYMLQIEEGTPLQKFLQKTPNYLPKDDDCVDIYLKASKFLKENGFNHYEISNFAKTNFESKHNIKYWIGENYIGFGLSAHSFIDGFRYANSSNFKDYYQGKTQLQEKLSVDELIEEHIMLGLRCNRGVDLNYLNKLGYNLENNKNLEEFLQKNILQKINNKIYLKDDYYGVSNFIIVKLLPY